MISPSLRNLLTPFLVAVSAICASMSASAAPNLITNGGFESGLSGWTATGFFAQGFDYGVDDQAHSGLSAFYGGAIGDVGVLSQSFATVAGGRYTLDLWLSSDGFLPNEFSVKTNTATLLDSVDILLQGYREVQLGFVAGSALTSLQFGFRNDSGALHIDDVTVQAIPEPSTIALMVGGLAVLGLRRRRRA